MHRQASHVGFHIPEEEWERMGKVVTVEGGNWHSQIGGKHTKSDSHIQPVTNFSFPPTLLETTTISLSSYISVTF